MNISANMPKAKSRKPNAKTWRVNVASSRPSALGLRPASAFTLSEVAISLAVIGIALVAIIGVLPLGMNVQRENREGTIVNQDATVFIEAISKGAQGLDDLTNYVYAITNHWTQFNANGTVASGGGSINNGYTYKNSSVIWPLSSGDCRLTNGFNIIGLLSTPRFTDNTGQPTNNLYSGGYSNHIVAYVRSLSGAAAEKPPQDNQIVRDDAFAYRLFCVNAAMPVDTNLFALSPAQQAYSKQLAANLHELRLTFFWPIQPNGRVGLGRQTYRTLIAGYVNHVFTNNVDLYFYQSQSFTNAP